MPPRYVIMARAAPMPKLPDACVSLQADLEFPVADSHWHVVLLPSGRVVDVSGDHEDAALMRECATLFILWGIAASIVALPVKRLWEDDIDKARTNRAAAAVLRVPSTRRIILLGHSLGGTTALAVAGKSACRHRLSKLALLSTVIDRPTTVGSGIDTINFIYGSRDHIAYVDDEMRGDVQVVPASIFGPESADKLILARKQRIRTSIVENVGHAMRANDDIEGSASALLLVMRTIAEECLGDRNPQAGK